MATPKRPARSATAAPSPGVDDALKAALERLLAPLAELCVARGVPFPAAVEMVKLAFVHAARAAAPSGGARDVSRVSTATGLTRREVTRITRAQVRTSVLRPSPATQVFTRWLSSARLHDKRGRPRPLRRQGRAPSFESLARSVTRDVHPRSLLEELVRLGLARVDEKTDSVELVRAAFVPTHDRARMYGFLGNNVGDHLAGAVANVLAQDAPHLEQAIFADGLSKESLQKVRELVGTQWKTLLTALVPKIQTLIDADRRSGRAADQRVRVGLYSFHAPMPAPGKPSKDS